MKLKSFIVIIIVFLSAYSSVHGYPGCGNCGYAGVAATSYNCCIVKGDKSPCGGKNVFFPYTGNVHREIRDLEVWGTTGEMPLTWTRYFNSRNGWQIWTHSYQYSMSDAGFDDQGRAQLRVSYPEGDENIFTQSSDDPNSWLPVRGVDKRLFQQGKNFFVQTPNGFRYRFEKLNSSVHGIFYQLQDFRDSYQNLYTLTYDSWHNLLRVTEPGGRFLQITYQTIFEKLLISKITTFDGRSISFQYTYYNDGILDWLLMTRVNYGDGTSARYQYAQSEPGRLMLLSHAIDPRLVGDAVNIKYIYDNNIAEGFIKEERNGLTDALIATLTSEEDERWVCYPNGKVDHYIVPDELFGETREHINGGGGKFMWDYQGINGFISATTDRLGRTKRYTRSIYENYLEIVHPDGSKEKWTRDDLDLVLTYTDELGRVTAYTRDNLHRVTKITYPDGSDERFTYNNLGQIVTHKTRDGGIETNTYNNRGLKTSFTDALGNITRYTYDNADKLASRLDALGNLTGYKYTERGLLRSVSNPDNSLQHYDYDEFGNLASFTNEIGNTWTFVFDEFRRISFATDPLNRVTQLKYSSSNDACGCANNQITPTQIIFPGGKTINYEYDVEGQVVKRTIAPGTPDAATTMYEWDLAGNLTATIEPLGNQFAFSFDLRNRMISKTNAIGNSTQWTYDATGNVLARKNADNTVEKYSYDNMNRTVQITEANGHATKITYDHHDEPSSIITPNSDIYLFEYDPTGHMVKMIYPNGTFEGYTYDAVGNLKSYVNRAGATCTYTYNNRNKLINSVWSESTPAISMTYDAAGRILSLNNQISLINYVYDKANQLINETQTLANSSGPKQLKYTYTAEGRLSTIDYPDPNILLKYYYTNRSQLAAVTVNDNNIISYAYDLNGNRIAQFLKNQVGSSYTYDNNNRLLSITHQKAGVAFMHLEYEYNNMDRVTFVKKNYGKGDAYLYDLIGQISDVKYGVPAPQDVTGKNVAYTYDASGNRSIVKEDQSVIDYLSNHLNQYTHVGGKLVIYNNNGELSAFAGWVYEYDGLGRLIRAANDSLTIELAYDAHNRCVKRTINGKTTFVYYHQWNIIEEHDQQKNSSAVYIYGAKTDEILSKIDEYGTTYYHSDKIGSITQLTNSSGDVVEQYSYDIFGKPTISDHNSNPITKSAFGNRFLFTGRDIVDGTTLYNYRNRVYSFEFGRFLQPDPVRFKAKDHNLYRYVRNNPVNATDPFGLTEHTGGNPPQPPPNTNPTAGDIIMAGVDPNVTEEQFADLIQDLQAGAHVGIIEQIKAIRRETCPEGNPNYQKIQDKIEQISAHQNATAGSNAPNNSGAGILSYLIGIMLIGICLAKKALWKKKSI